MATKDINDKQNVNPSKKHRLLAYFRDNQMVFLVTHENEKISDNMLKKLREKVESQLIQGGTIELVPDVLPQRFSFPAIKEGEARLDELKRLDAALKKEVEDKHGTELKNLEDALKEKKDLHPLHQILLGNASTSSA